QTITATDAVNPSITGTSNIIGVSFPATHFAIIANTNTTAGTPVTFTITALDKNNQTAYVYTPVFPPPPNNTVHFTSTDNNAILPRDSQLLFGSGVFTVTFVTSGIQTLTAVDTDNPKTIKGSATFIVGAAVASHFQISAPPSATSASGFTITVQ